jgi:S-adenosyl-L-methionine hydrolase (adenosine-forming)
MPRVVTLTTDFGLRDHYVAAMKGVILGRAPDAILVDVTHEITPFEIPEAAFVISQAWRTFPKGSIHLVVVDPGVGTSRRPLVVKAAGHYFVGPDNGVFAMIYSEELHEVREVNTETFLRNEISRTFHGRDVFAPVAGELARRVAFGRVGRQIEDHLQPTYDRPVRTDKRNWTGTVLKIDRFGNLITSYRTSEFAHVLEKPFALVAGPHRIERIAHTYAEMDPGEAYLIPGSAGYLEISAREASAARMLGIGVGAPLDLTLFGWAIGTA